MWITLLALIFSAYAPLPENSFHCPNIDVDLRRPGGSMESIPISDQGNTYLCAQFTTASLIDAWRSQRENPAAIVSTRTSPLALGIEFASESAWPLWFPLQNTTDPLSTHHGRWGGMVCPLLRQARTRGTCHAALGDTGATSGETVDRAMRAYAEIDRQGIDAPYGKLRTDLLGECSDPQNRRQLSDLPSCETTVYGGLDFVGAGHLGDTLRKNSPFLQLRKLLTRPKALPVAIAFCGAVFKDGPNYVNRSILEGACHAHWALVIGMRENTQGKCEVLLRNSHGPGTGHYSDAWPLDRNDPWLDAETLNRSIYAIEWLNESPR